MVRSVEYMSSEPVNMHSSNQTRGKTEAGISTRTYQLDSPSAEPYCDHFISKQHHYSLVALCMAMSAE
jgi:hypothetical protein